MKIALTLLLMLASLGVLAQPAIQRNSLTTNSESVALNLITNSSASKAPTNSPNIFTPYLYGEVHVTNSSAVHIHHSDDTANSAVRFSFGNNTDGSTYVIQLSASTNWLRINSRVGGAAKNAAYFFRDGSIMLGDGAGTVTTNSGDFRVLGTAFDANGNPYSTNSGGSAAIATNSTQFGESTELTLKEGALVTNINVHTALNLEGSAPTLYNTTGDGSMRIGVAPGAGGIQVQIFGPTYPGQEGNGYFDTASAGRMYFRFNGFASSVQYPASGDMNWAGFNTSGTPVETNIAAVWIRLEIDGVTTYIPGYR